MPPGAVSSVRSVIAAGQAAENSRPWRYPAGRLLTELRSGCACESSDRFPDRVPGHPIALKRPRSVLRRAERRDYLQLHSPMTDPTELTAFTGIPLFAMITAKEKILTTWHYEIGRWTETTFFEDVWPDADSRSWDTARESLGYAHYTGIGDDHGNAFTLNVYCRDEPPRFIVQFSDGNIWDAITAGTLPAPDLPLAGQL